MAMNAILFSWKKKSNYLFKLCEINVIYIINVREFEFLNNFNINSEASWKKKKNI